MKVAKFTLDETDFEKSPGQDAEIFTGNRVDQRHGGPVTVGFGRYAPHQSLPVKLAVHDTMIVLEGELWVETDEGELHAGAGDIVYMPEGESVTIRSRDVEAVTAYVTFPHWQVAEGAAK